MPSPVIDLNRAIAHSMAFGPQRGLSLIADIEAAPLLQDYAPLPAAKGDFLFRVGRRAEARAAFERVAWLTRNEHERIFCSRAGRPAAIEGRRGDTEKNLCANKGFCGASGLKPPESCENPHPGTNLR